MSRVCGIYEIHNLRNGKCYVGQSTNVVYRLRVHKSLLRAGTHPNLHLQSAFLKYGEDAFEFSVVESAPEELLDKLEMAMIQKRGSSDPKKGYNNDLGGRANRSFSAQTREKMAASHRGKKMSKETRAKMSAAQRGRKHSAATKKRMSEKAKLREPRVASEETKKKISEGLRRAWRRGARSKKDMSERVSAAWRDDKYRSKASAASKRAWTAERRAAFSILLKKRWADPNFRERVALVAAQRAKKNA